MHGLYSCQFDKGIFFPLGVVRVYESSLISCLESLSDKEFLMCGEANHTFFPCHWIWRIEAVSHSVLFSSCYFFTKVLIDIQNRYHWEECRQQPPHKVWVMKWKHFSLEVDKTHGNNSPTSSVYVKAYSHAATRSPHTWSLIWHTQIHCGSFAITIVYPTLFSLHYVNIK